MEHSFDINVAKEYGLIPAVILRHFLFWVTHNEAHKKHRHDGHTWTFASVSSLTKIFPYLTKEQIRYSLDKLQSSGVLLTGNYNPKGFDRTKWYAIAPEYLKSMRENSQVHLGNFTNGFGEIPNPIPDSITDNSTDSSDESVGKEPTLYQRFIKTYHDWFKNRIGVPPKINGEEGKAAKALIVYLKNVVQQKHTDGEPANDTDVIDAWSFILGAWDALDKWHRERYKLAQIDSDISNIMAQIKKQYEQAKNRKEATSREEWLAKIQQHTKHAG